jgi:hypothetical protein
MLFDSKRGHLVVFSARGTSELVAGVWSAPFGDPLPPGLRSSSAIAFDGDRGRAVLFGGMDAQYVRLGDTWEWDSRTAKWMVMTPPGFTPRARSGHALVYDAARKKTVLYGGSAGSLVQDYMEDTWTWDGASWTRVGSARTAHPEPRYGHHMAFDTARGKVVLFGRFGEWWDGGRVNVSYGNTWEWDGASWTLASTVNDTFTSEDPTSLPMAYDTRRGTVVRFDVEGARYETTFTVKEWTGSVWQTVSVGAGPKVGNASATNFDGAYDASRGRFALAPRVLAAPSYAQTPEFFTYSEPNRAPVLAPVAPVRAFVGEEVAVALSAVDSDGHAVHYEVTPLPAGATFDSTSGALRWTPATAQTGLFTMKAIASDGCLASESALSVRVDSLAYAGLPGGTVKLGGTVRVPLAVRARGRGYVASPDVACAVAGQNPGKVTVTCEAPTTSAFYPGDLSTWTFTPAVVSAVVEPNLTFVASPGDVEFAGRLEPLSDGTYKLHIQRYAQPHREDPIDMQTSPADAYGIVDMVP